MGDKLDPKAEVIKHHDQTKLAHDVFDGKYHAPKNDLDEWKNKPDHQRGSNESAQAYEQRAQREVKTQHLAKQLGLPEGCKPVGIAKGGDHEYLIVKRKEGNVDAMYTVEMKSGKLHQRFEKQDGNYLPVADYDGEKFKLDKQNRVSMMQTENGKVEFGYADGKAENNKPNVVTWHHNGSVIHYTQDAHGKWFEQSMSEAKYQQALAKNEKPWTDDKKFPKTPSEVNDFETKIGDDKRPIYTSKGKNTSGDYIYTGTTVADS